VRLVSDLDTGIVGTAERAYPSVFVSATYRRLLHQTHRTIVPSAAAAASTTSYAAATTQLRLDGRSTAYRRSQGHSDVTSEAADRLAQQPLT